MPAHPRRADRLGDHLIVCGDGPLSYRITDELTSRYGEHVTVILPDRRQHHGPQISALPRVRVLEYPELSSQAFTDADVQSARALAVLWQDDVGNLHAGLRAQELNSGLRDPADLVLAVADGTPRNPLARQRNPALVLAGMLRRLAGGKFALVFAALLVVAVAGFVLLQTRYALVDALYLTVMDMTGSAFTNSTDTAPEKVAQVLLIADVRVANGLAGRFISDTEQDGQARVLALQASGAAALDWSPHRGYLLAAGERLVVLATRRGLRRFLSVH
jgi:hypothetical protein